MMRVIAMMIMLTMLAGCSGFKTSLKNKFALTSELPTSYPERSSSMSDYEYAKLTKIHKIELEESLKRDFLSSALSLDEWESNRFLSFYDDHLEGIGWRKFQYSFFDRPGQKFEMDASEKNRSVMLNYTIRFLPRNYSPLKGSPHLSYQEDPQ